MKLKIINLMLVSLTLCTILNAQTDTTNKWGEYSNAKPKSGDFAVGISAMPYINFLGNVLNNTSNQSLNLSNTTLYGRYYLDPSTSIKLVLQVNNFINKDNYYVVDDAAIVADPLSKDMVVDKSKRTYRNTYIGIGYEKHKSHRRLEAYYGGMLGYSYYRDKYEYTFGNPMSELNPTPSSVFSYIGNARTLNNDGGIYNTISLSGILGIEYFVLPRLSIGAEMSLRYSYEWSTQSNSKLEEWNTTSVYEYEKLNSPGDKYSSLGTSFPSTYGGLFLMFYF